MNKGLFRKGHVGYKYWLGKKRDPDTIDKIRKAHVGKKISAEHRKKLSLAMKMAGNRPPSNKGKTYEELYGVEKAMALRKLRSESRKGEKCNWWRGTSWQNRNKHVGTKYSKWRITVFQRDDWTCCACGRKGGYMEAHHLKSWKNFPGLRLVVDNGITLCKKPCHILANKVQRRIENNK